MNAEPTILKTDTEQALAELYRGVREGLPGLPAVLARRDERFAEFEGVGLPHRRVEEWKYTDLRAKMRAANPTAEKPSVAAVEHALAASPTFTGLDRFRLVIADGYFEESLSDREALLAEGVEIATLAEFLGFDSPSVLDVLNAPEGAERDAMVALNAAIATDGVVILMPDGCVPSRPIELVHVTTDGEPRAWNARSVARVGAGAKARLLVSHIGPERTPYQSNSFVGLHLEKDADVSVVDLQRQGDAAQHITTFSAELAERSVLRHLAIASGSAIARLQGFVSIKGEAAELGVAGANMLAGSEHGDITWRIDHSVPAATSRVLYQNASADTAFGAFQGLILVRPEAQQTDGRMMTRSLLLSEESQFVAKPELEIYADDVQCGHGATFGQIDQDTLFYLMSRGIPRDAASAMLVRGFLHEALETLGDTEIAASLEPVIDRWLEARSP